MSDLIHDYPKTKIAILRTMGNLHQEKLRYDIQRLKQLVIEISPDLLCVDFPKSNWEGNDLANLPLEVREALMPAIEVLNTILLPVAPTLTQLEDYKPSAGLRSKMARGFDQLLQWGQKRANSPEAIHGMAFETFCHTVCLMDEMTWDKRDREAYQQYAEQLADEIVDAVKRDPGGRVLLVVRCQWQHILEPLLKKKAPWLEIVDYQDL